MSETSTPGQYSIIPTKALWNWSKPVVGQAPVVQSYPPYGTPTKSGVTPQDLANYLLLPYPMVNYSTVPPTPIADSVVNGWIRYAEDNIETETNVRLCQTWIAAPAENTSYATQTVGLGVSGSFQNLGVDYDYSEAAYDFFFDRVRDEGWFYQRMRWRPVQSIELFQPAGQFDESNLSGIKNWAMVYPLLNQYFRIPPSWVVLDSKRGLIRAVPAVDVAVLPLYALQLTALGFAQNVPGGMHFQYTAGLTANDYNSEWSFMKQLVMVKAGIRALTAIQLGINLGAVETQTQADGLLQKMKFSEKGALYGNIKMLQEEEKQLLKRAKMMGGGIALGIL